LLFAWGRSPTPYALATLNPKFAPAAEEASAAILFQ